MPKNVIITRVQVAVMVLDFGARLHPCTPRLCLPSCITSDLLEVTCFGHKAKVRSVDAEEEWPKPRSSNDVSLSSTSSYPVLDRQGS